MDAPELGESKSITPTEQDLIDIMYQAENYMTCSCNNVRSFYQSCLNRAAARHFNTLFDIAFSSYTYSDLDLVCPLIAAAEYGNTHALRKIIERSKEAINYVCVQHSDCKRRGTALVLASSKGHSDVVSYLLLWGADPHIGTGTEQFPLIQAIKNDKSTCTQVLLEGRVKNKANPNCEAPDEMFGSLLHWALSLGNRNAHVKHLIENGAAINFMRKGKKYEQEGTPLMVAVAYANLDGVKMLLDAKADISVKKTFNRHTAKQQAALSWHIESNPEKKNTRHQILSLLTSAESNSLGILP